MKWFSDCMTIEQLKRKYHLLAVKYHPDHGGDVRIMQEINAEFSEQAKRLKNRHEKTEDAENETSEKEQSFNADKFMHIISRLIHFDGVKIEICGSWIWVTGNTYPYREELKAIGFNWSKSKKAWYYAEYLTGKHKGRKTLEQIRNEYGSETIENRPHIKIKAGV